MSEVRIASASPRIWLTKRMMRRVLGGLVEVAVVRALVGDDLEAFFLLQEVERVRADAEVLLDFALHAPRSARAPGGASGR